MLDRVSALRICPCTYSTWTSFLFPEHHLHHTITILAQCHNAFSTSVAHIFAQAYLGLLVYSSGLNNQDGLYSGAKRSSSMLFTTNAMADRGFDPQIRLYNIPFWFLIALKHT